MNTILSHLAEIIRQHPLTEKILVAPSHAAGHMLLDSLVSQGRAWFNLRVTTPLQLALELAQPILAEQQITLATPGQLRALLEQELSAMEEKNELKYFANLRSSSDLTAILLPPLLELRLAGVEAPNIASFIDPEKGRELGSLLQSLDSQLAINRLADQARVFSLACSLDSTTNTHSKPLYLIPQDISCSALELAFLQSLQNPHILPSEPVVGLTPAKRDFIAEHDNKPTSPFSYLYSLADAPAQTPNLKLFQSYGVHNECREVLRRLKAENIPLDHAVVACTTPGTYIPQFLSLSQSLGVPMTFGAGYSVLYTRPGKLLQSLLRYLASNYLDSELIRLLQSGAAKISSVPHCVRMLRKLKIGWGRERYSKLAALTEKEAPDESDLDLHKFVSTLFAELPEPRNGSISLPSLCCGLSAILEQYARVTSETEGQALLAIRSEFSEVALTKGVTLPFLTAIERISHTLEGINVGASLPIPSHLHVSSYDAANWQSRQHTFVVGLDSGSFPGTGLQDPILLDKERQVLSSALKLRALEPSRNLYNMVQFLASRRGAVTLSFACHDTIEGRGSSPCSLLLQAYRLQQQRPTADYSELLQALGSPVCYSPLNPSACLSEDEWWMVHALSGTVKTDLDSVLACYPDLLAGVEAEECRNSLRFTPYDGAVEGVAGLTITASATELELLAKCPFAYYLRYILKLYPIEETQEDTSVWLDPAERGSLLHEAYCTYMRTIASIDGEQDKALLYNIADQVIAEYRLAIPAPSDLVYEYQRREILNSLAVFWRIETELTTIPLYFEVPFGLGEAAVTKAGFGSAEPIELKLGDGRSIRLKGIIDRIDLAKPHCYEVWDFKTGSTYGYDERFYLKAGTQMQHALYSWALEEMLHHTGLDPAAQVTTAGYLFPTEKGEGLRVPRHQRDRTVISSALTTLLDIVEQGAFCATHDDGRCKFCDYVPVCRGKIATERALSKKDSELNSELAPWKELQRYE